MEARRTDEGDGAAGRRGRPPSYAGLLARTEAEGTADGLAAVHDLDSDLTLEAARQACEELTAVAMEAGAWLLDALRSGESRYTNERFR